jgi:hypothetical protein
MGGGTEHQGEIVASAADWLRVMPSGVNRLDVRLTIRTDDGDLIVATYGGAIQFSSKERVDSPGKGQPSKADDRYVITVPTFETKAEKCAWLNAIPGGREDDRP